MNEDMDDLAEPLDDAADEYADEYALNDIGLALRLHAPAE
jgi:hypothetical protein